MNFNGEETLVEEWSMDQTRRDILKTAVSMLITKDFIGQNTLR